MFVAAGMDTKEMESYAKVTTYLMNTVQTKPLFTIIFIADIDECASSESNNCDVNALCTNAEGSYICRCKKGYEGDGLYCNGTYVIYDLASLFSL